MKKQSDKTTPEWANIAPKTFANEQEFVLALKNEEDRAWDEFYELYDTEIRFFVWRMLRLPKHELEDDVQNVYAKMMHAIQNFEHACPLHYFVRKVTTDLCTDTIRRKIKKDRLFRSMTKTDDNNEVYEHEGIAPQSTDVHMSVFLNERKRAIREVISTLSDRCRNVITLRYFKQEEYKRIAEELALSINTIGSRLRKCMDKMVKELAAYQ